MKHKRSAFALAAAILALTGCSLARPEETAGGEYSDVLAGLYVVHYDSTEDANDFYENPNLVEYGSFSADTEFGTLSFPDQVLMGQYDEENHTYIFPGMREGWGLFSLQLEENGATYNTVVCDMSSNGTHYITNDEGEAVEIEGTVYIGPPAGAGPDWDILDSGGRWKFYHVYQAADGSVYLNGYGDSTNSGGAYSMESTSTTTVNGETTSKSVKATVNIETVERLEKLTVSQFDENNLLLQTEEIPLGGELAPVAWGEGTAWALVEEHRTNGVTRTVYTVPAAGEEPIYHPVVIIDGEGMGCSISLIINK